MKLFKLFPAIVISIALISCGGGDTEQEKEAEEVTPGLTAGLNALVEAGEQMEKSASAGEAKMKERRAKGDTLAMPYAELQKFLPELDGYTRGEPDGANVNMGAMSYATAEAKYTKGDDRVKITIMDYNQAYPMYTAATAMWAMGVNVDTPTEKAGSVKLSDQVAGWEVFKKKARRAELMLGVGSRFWLNIEANNQDNTDLVKNIAKSIDLSKLSSL